MTVWNIIYYRMELFTDDRAADVPEDVRIGSYYCTRGIYKS